MNTFEELKAAVEANQNVLSVKMEALRDIFGVKRLGIHVCTEITRKLSGVGLGTFPEELEPDAWMDVRVFKLGTPMGELLTAANRPGENEDQVLRTAAENDASETIEQIKALVCA
jgi:hypothetical protein